MTALVFPVGHYLGPIHDDAGAPARHGVRVGSELLRLATDAEAAVWIAAHGTVDGGPVTRDAVHAAVPARLRAGASAAFDALRAAGLVAEAVPGSVAFARQYTLGSLMIGVGTTPDGAGGLVIGMGELAVAVDEPLFRLWECAPDHPTLWAACEDVAAPQDPVPLLTTAMAGLHGLLAVNAAYLDTSR